ncbi:MAG: MBL fold metallo-hydrolase [Thermoanaerobaculia bacterium]|nr:MBL fold metallo-hydrolase [Thermoanaerobaculia bacterium]
MPRRFAAFVGFHRLRIFFLSALLAPSVFLGAATALVEPPPDPSSPSPEFQLVEVAAGVWVALQPHDERFNDANAVFVVGEQGLLAIDSPTNEEFLERAIEALKSKSTRPLRYLINTHWHGDHTQGNALYRRHFGDDFEIVGHRSLTEDVPGRAQTDFAERTGRWEAAIQAAEERLAKGVDREGKPLDAAGKTQLATDIVETREMVATRATVRFLPPTLTYADRLSLQRVEGPVELIHFRGHTRGDTVVFLPAQRVLVTGDLLDALPYGGHGYPSDWLIALDSLSELDFDHIVPGHGPIFEGKKQLDTVRQLIGSIIRHAEAAVAAGQTLEQAKATLDLTELQNVLVDDDTAQRNWNAFIPATLERAFAESAGTLDATE